MATTSMTHGARTLDARLRCPVCLSPSAAHQDCKDATIHYCAQCSHRFSDLATLRNVETYGPEYFEKNWFQNDNMQLFDISCDALNGLSENASILDVGCGTGAFLRYLRGKRPGFELTGVDLAPAKPSAGIEFIQGDIYKTQLPKQYDAIVNLALIEHLDDVRGFTNRLFDLCSPGGRVVISTVNDTSLLYSIARALKSVGFKLPSDQLYSSHHLNHFSKASLRRLMEGRGFTVERTILHDIPLAAVDISSKNPILTRVLRVGVWGIFTLGDWMKNNYCQTIVCKRPVS